MRFLILGLAAILGVASPKPTAPKPKLSLGVMQVSAPGDSLKYILHWTTTSDALGAATYNVNVNSSKGFSLAHNIPTMTDSFTTVKPAIGDSVSFAVKVQAVRRGLVSATATASWRYIRKDVPPPTPGPIVVDSSKVIGLFVRPDIIQLAAGDTVRVCAFIIMGDSSIRLGVDTSAAAAAQRQATINYCSGVPLTQFLSERKS